MRINLILIIAIILSAASCKTSQENIQPLDNYHKNYNYKQTLNT
jgi:hypothetical protein